MKTIFLILVIVLGTLTSTASDLVAKARLVDAMMNDTTPEELLKAYEDGTMYGKSLKSITQVPGLDGKRKELVAKSHVALRRIIEQAAISQFTLTELKMIKSLREKDEAGRGFALKIICMGSANDMTSVQEGSKLMMQLAKEVSDSIQRSKKPGRERILHDRKP